MKLNLQPGRTVYAIDTGALNHNLDWYADYLDSDVGIIVVLKDRAYGSGLVEVAQQFAQHPKLAYFAVARTFEGTILRKAGIKQRIIVLNPSPDSIAELYTSCLEPEVYSLSLLRSIVQQLGDKPLQIHVKLDSGMHRLGLYDNELDILADVLIRHPNIKIATVLSHLTASSDPQHDDFTNEQHRRFLSSAKYLESKLGQRFKKHLANTAAIVRHKNTHFDYVRLGIGLYGLGGHAAALKNVCSLHSAIADIKWVPQGETVSYNRSFKAHRKTRIAALFIGYSDGINRHLGNGNWYVKINGQKAFIIGDVCMDVCLIDITDIEAELGDEAVFFQSIEEIQAMSNVLDTIPYEILTTVDQGIERRYN